MTFETPGPVEESLRDAISPIEEIIEDARQGRMYILVDHEDRENEGDLIIPAEFADADAINFMATHGRGLICLPMTAERIERLGLPMMAVNNSSRMETAFTVSIEAREGVTTGISAGDRALTVGANQPYSGRIHGGYSVPVHAERNGLPHVSFEVRQDLIGTRERAEGWGERLAAVLEAPLGEPSLYRRMGG